MDVKIKSGWKNILKNEFKQDYFIQLVELLHLEQESKGVIYPPGSLIFNAFNKTDFDDVKVVILGQDPYHGAGEAHGLSFSVPKGIKPPPSLVNIYKEIEADLGVKMPRNYGNLEAWAKQGVFLLNAALTVKANLANSHAGIGWHNFTNKAIELLSKNKEHLVFLLWGNFAKEKLNLIDTSKHLVLLAPHPSPLSAHKGFLGCRHFSKTNEYLMKNRLDPIDWQITES
jgi:uracil-DNA glycosylase